MGPSRWYQRPLNDIDHRCDTSLAQEIVALSRRHSPTEIHTNLASSAACGTIGESRDRALIELSPRASWRSLRKCGPTHDQWRAVQTLQRDNDITAFNAPTTAAAAVRARRVSETYGAGGTDPCSSCKIARNFDTTPKVSQCIDLVVKDWN
jgi:hypothetical protein